MTLVDEMRVYQAPRTAGREVDGRAVVVIIDTNTLHTLDPVGSHIWAHCDGRSVAELVETVVEEFEVDAVTARADLGRFLGQLNEIGAVEIRKA